MPEALMAPQLAAALREARRDLLATVAQLSETRVFRATDRDGWTVKHELAYLAAADHLLLALIEELPHAQGTPITIAATQVALRRLRGQYMHVTQELRLGPLSDELARLGDQTANAIECHADVLDRLVVLGGQPATALEHASSHLERARKGAERVLQAIG